MLLHDLPPIFRSISLGRKAAFCSGKIQTSSKPPTADSRDLGSTPAPTRPLRFNLFNALMSLTQTFLQEHEQVYDRVAEGWVMNSGATPLQQAVGKSQPSPMGPYQVQDPESQCYPACCILCSCASLSGYRRPPLLSSCPHLLAIRISID